MTGLFYIPIGGRNMTLIRMRRKDVFWRGSMELYWGEGKE